MFFVPIHLSGVGAYPFPFDVLQADSTLLKVKLHGDEWFNWLSVEDGYRIIKNNDGFFEYANILKSGKIVPSGVRAFNPLDRGTEETEYLKKIQPGSGFSPKEILAIRQSYFSSYLKSNVSSTYFPSVGQQKLLVILVSFSDTRASYSRDDFDNLLNGYDRSGSFRDYYLENSGGQLDIISTVTEWVTVPNSKSYYGPEKKWGEFAMHAIHAAAAQGIDFSEFDNNGDGIVEGIAIIHQGAGQEITGDEEDIWSHSWSLSSSGFSLSQRTFNGVELNRYSIQPEIRGSTGLLNTIGVFCHEFGHVLGIPDYYDTGDDELTNSGPGRWDIMASGTYNGSPSGSSPAHHNAYTKIELGWVNEIEISEAQRYILPPIISGLNIFRINSPLENEYLLLENRQQEGYDSALPGKGMLVYHIDAEHISAKRESNDVNVGDKQGLYVMAAGGSVNSASAPFPGSLNITELTDDTSPAAITWSGLPFNRSITGIHLDKDEVLFDFMAIQNGSPLALKAKAQNHEEINIEWVPSIDHAPVLLAWSYDNIFGEPEYDIIYDEGSIIDGGGTVLYFGDQLQTIQHTALLPATDYYYKIWSKQEESWSLPIATHVKTRPLPVNEFPWEENFDLGLELWSQELIVGSYFWETLKEGIEQRPPEAYMGDNFASFFASSFSLNVTRIVSPIMEFDPSLDYILEFRHVQHKWDGAQDKLKVMVKPIDHDEWNELAFYQDHVGEWTQRKLALPFSGFVKIAFEAHGNYGYGVAIDNVKVREGKHCNDVFPLISGLEVSEVSETEMHLSWLPLEEDLSVLIVARKKYPITGLANQGEVYQANPVFGEGSELENSSFIVYSGSGNEVILTNLEHSSEYHFAFFVFDEDHCYSFKPQTYSFSTKQRFHTISFFVTDGEKPLENVKFEIKGESFLSDTNGKAWWIEGHAEENVFVSAQKSAYYDSWKRIKPDSEQIVEFVLLPVETINITGLRHKHNNRTVDLTWNPVIEEHFDNYKAFSLALPGWTMIDGDQATTYGIKEGNFPNQGYTGSFIVIDPVYEGLHKIDYDLLAVTGRQVLAAFSAFGKVNDDWLISPSIFVEPGFNFNFLARSLTDKYGLERIRVLVSDLDSRNQEFLPLSDGDYVEVPVDWTSFSFSLDKYVGRNIRLAIHYVSDDALTLLIDNIRIITDKQKDLPVFIKTRATTSSSLNINRKAYKGRENSFVTLRQSFLAEKISVQSSHITYIVELNNKIIGELSGFDKTSLRFDVDECCDNLIEISAYDFKYGLVSEDKATYIFDACYNVSFIVTDEFNMPLRNVAIKFDDLISITDENGETVFSGIEGGKDILWYVDHDGFKSASDNIDVDSNVQVMVVLETLNIDSSLVYEDIVLYPVPAYSDLYIEGVSEGNLIVDIYDVSGRRIYSGEHKVEKGTSIKTSFLPQGVYIIKLQRGKTAFYYKIVKGHTH